MKSLIIAGLLSIAVADASASIPPNIVHVPNSTTQWTETVICGDINRDNTVNVADAVLFQQCMTSGEYGDNIAAFDINFDGIIDSFDMILMRQIVINPETASTHTYTIDMLKTADNISEYGEVFTNAGDMSAYLSEFISTDEVQTYLEKYNDTFFEENNLILMPFTQKYGKGVFYNVKGIGKINPKKSRGINDDIFIQLETSYAAYRVLYPVTDTKLLIQAAVPKTDFHAGDNIFVYDTDEINSNMESTVYTSPDGKRELYITQETLGNVSDIRVFLKNSKISYKALASLTAYGEKPFTPDGEWSTDSDGNSVFSNGTTYSITWLDDSVIIDHQTNDNEWEWVRATFEDEDVTYEYYVKD